MNMMECNECLLNFFFKALFEVLKELSFADGFDQAVPL